MKKLAIGLSAAVLALTGTAFAAHHEGRIKPDSNGDGVVTREESQAHALAMFAKLDVNNDGLLNAADHELRREQMREKMFAKLDADNNGSISQDEFMAFEGPGKHRKGMGKADGEGPGKHHRRGMRGHGGGMKMMKMADTNNDGAVSQDEFAAAAANRFARIDANNDGKISKEERQAHRQEMRGKWRDRPES
jgi:hypothetical protein